MRNRTLLQLLIPFTLFTYMTAADTHPSEEKNAEAPWSRDSVVQSVSELERARQNALEALRESVAKMAHERAIRLGDYNHSLAQEHETEKISETLAAADVVKAAASVEVAKAKAGRDIAQAVASVEKVKNSQQKDAPNSKVLQQVEITATKKIAHAIDSVKKAESDAAQQVERAGRNALATQHRPVVLAHPQEALSVAHDVGSVEIARAVSAVKIARAVSAVEITRSIVDAEASKPLDESAAFQPLPGDLPLDRVKANAAAAIANSVAKVEISKANALADIARAVAITQIAEILEKRAKQEKEALEQTAKRRAASTYPRLLIRIEE